MKFTPSSKFLAIARSSFKVISKKVYFRKTSTLTTALNAGTWIDATRFIDSIPDANTSIEYDLGNFKADALKLTAKNITWMNANVFNASSSEYIECKIELLIGFDASDMASDVIYHFSGYVDKNTIFPVEATDKTSFTVDSADALMQKIEASAITTQYIDGTSGGTALLNIPGVSITNCNITSYVMNAGVHTIAYDYNNGEPQMRLNSGAWVNIWGGGTFTLGDGETSDVDTQRVTVSVDSALYALNDAPREEEIIIATTGTTLPATWIHGMSMKNLAAKLYNAIGITTQTFGTLQCSAQDSTKRVSFFGYALESESASNIGNCGAIAYKNATTIYFSTKNRVYSYNPATNAATYLFTVSSGAVISRLIYNARNDHLWIISGDVAVDSYGGYVFRYAFGSSTLTATVNGAAGARFYSLELFDTVNEDATYKYGIVFVNGANNSIDWIEGTTVTRTVLFSGGAIGYVLGPVDGFAYKPSVTTFRFFSYKTSIATNQIHEIVYDVSTKTWGAGSIVNTNPPLVHKYGGYISGSSKVFAYNSSVSPSKIVKYDYNGTSTSDVVVLDSHDAFQSIFSDDTNIFVNTKMRTLTVIDNSSVRVENIAFNVFASAPYCTGNSRVYGIDMFGRIFQIGTTIELFVDWCQFTDKMIKGAMTDALRATNCVSTMSFAKAALIYPRGDAAGDPITSGNSIAINVSNINDIQKNDAYGKAFDVVALDNGVVKTNYNGTAFDTLPVTLNMRTLTIKNTMIPSNVIKDYCVLFYNFFKTARTLYTFPVLQTYHHIEPMDGASPTLSTTKIPITATSKPIYSATYSADGKMKVGVLI